MKLNAEQKEIKRKTIEFVRRLDDSGSAVDEQNIYDYIKHLILNNTKKRTLA